MMRPRDAADRGADRDLAPPPGRAHEQQVRDVGAGDQQHEADGADEHEQRVGRTLRTSTSRIGCTLNAGLRPERVRELAR